MPPGRHRASLVQTEEGRPTSARPPVWPQVPEAQPAVRRYALRRTRCRTGRRGSPGSRPLRAAAGPADSCAVTLIQSFGSPASRNILLRGLVLDGMYRRLDGGVALVQVAMPTDEDVHAALRKIVGIIQKMLKRRGAPART